MLACYQVVPKKSTNQLATMSCLIIRTFRVLAPPSKCLQCLAGLNQPPLLGFAVRPSIDILDRDCVFVRVLPLASVPRYHRETRAVRVVSHHFDGLSRERLARILHPAADHGVRCVSCACQAVICQGRAVRNIAVPTTHFVPFEESPSPVAVLRHRSLCLPAVRHVHPRYRSIVETPPTRMGSDPPKWIPTHPADPCASASIRYVKRTQSPVTRRRANVSCGASASRLSSTDESVASYHRCQ